MRSARVGVRRVDLHGSAYTTFLHAQCFGRQLHDDLDSAAGGDLRALARLAWSMAATADRACGRPTEALAQFQRGISLAPDLLEAVEAEAVSGCFARPRGGSSGGGARADVAVLALAISRGVAPGDLALASTEALLEAVSPREAAPSARPATAADINRLLG